MDDMIYLLFISIFVPIMLMANLIEKKARLPIVFVLTGMFISVFAAEVNGVLQAVLPLSHYELTIIVTPISEEVLKALPILFYALVKSDKQEILFTASMATGIGFAVLENAYYLLNAETWNVMDAVIRAFGAGLMHGMCTLLVGVGITFVKKKRKVFWVGTFALLSTAITYHGIYNMLVQSRYDVIGYLLPISTYIPSLVWRVKKHVKTSKLEKS
jgi:RsiW-degrading membrane proteinase PrsW (M82 family)